MEDLRPTPARQRHSASGRAITPALINDPPPTPLATNAHRSSPMRTSKRPSRRPRGWCDPSVEKRTCPGEFRHPRRKRPGQMLAATLQHADAFVSACLRELRGGHGAAIARAHDHHVEIDARRRALRIALQRGNQRFEPLRQPACRSIFLALTHCWAAVSDSWRFFPEPISCVMARCKVCADTGLCSIAMPALVRILQAIRRCIAADEDGRQGRTRGTQRLYGGDAVLVTPQPQIDEQDVGRHGTALRGGLGDATCRSHLAPERLQQGLHAPAHGLFVIQHQHPGSREGWARTAILHQPRRPRPATPCWRVRREAPRR